MTDQDPNSGSHERRSVLKALGVGGLAATGLGASAGNAAAKKGGKSGKGGGFKQLTFDVSKSGTITENVDAVDTFDVGDDVDFDGTLTFTDLYVNENDELVASGQLKGTLSGSPAEQISQTFQDVVLGLLDSVLGILQPDSAGECPILNLDVGEIFLDLLGLQIETSTIEIDITAVAGAGNLLGNLLCAVAGLLDPA